MMLLAQAETVGRVVDAATKSATDYGLIGVLLVLVLVGVGGFTWAVFRFAAPRLSALVASTCSLHESLKETNLRLSITMDSMKSDHGSKLSDICEMLETQRCPMLNQPRPLNPPTVSGPLHPLPGT